MSPDHRVARSVTIAELAREVGGSLIGADDARPIIDVVHDSRQARPGSLFVCLPGSSTDGHDHAHEAIQAGAVALVCERPLDLGVPELRVESSRSTVGPLASAFFGHPAESLELVAITGTNGKTTVAHLVAAICEAAGRPAATIGTLTGLHTTPTTPEAIELHRHLARLRDGGTRVVALEVSSHALVLQRVDGLVADLAVFTNLSRDHLDFHGTMEAYFQAKARLFEPTHARAGLVNLDDPHGRLLSDASVIPTAGYRLVDAVDLVLARDHSRFTWRGTPLRLALPGAFNVSNALAAAGAADHLGIDPAAIAEGLASARPVSGRFERVELGAPFDVVIDYAHTPDALHRVLEDARRMAGRVRVVFGCGGDKDRTKRAPMGEIASRLADHVVLTSDNPRSEPPEAIIAEIRQGMGRTDHVDVEPDRRAAIALALGAAQPGDLIVVAGKGHETEQVIGGQHLPFDDHLVVVEEYAHLVGTRR